MGLTKMGSTPSRARRFIASVHHQRYPGLPKGRLHPITTKTTPGKLEPKSATDKSQRGLKLHTVHFHMQTCVRPSRLGQVDHKKNAKGTEASPTGQRVPRGGTLLPWETRTSNHEATKAERRRQHKQRRQPSWNALREQREWGREETRTCKHECVSPLYLSRGHCKAPITVPLL